MRPSFVFTVLPTCSLHCSTDMFTSLFYRHVYFTVLPTCSLHSATDMFTSLFYRHVHFTLLPTRSLHCSTDTFTSLFYGHVHFTVLPAGSLHCSTGMFTSLFYRHVHFTVLPTCSLHSKFLFILYPTFLLNGRHSVVCTATRYELGGPEIHLWTRRDLPCPSRPAPTPTQPSAPWVPGLSQE